MLPKSARTTTFDGTVTEEKYIKVVAIYTTDYK